ncbi:hypothetical protein [Formivibrio citricus]|uniref:hypothetical protein n=1 Tax=Formivibrio citricus TaxID=83765 RepID=UPI00116066A6|nr:hypothetical protein [Formivibrio citricus]
MKQSPRKIRGCKPVSSGLLESGWFGYRTVQDIERGQSEGTVKTMNQILGIIGLRLGVVPKRIPNQSDKEPADNPSSAKGHS